MVGRKKRGGRGRRKRHKQEHRGIEEEGGNSKYSKNEIG